MCSQGSCPGHSACVDCGWMVQGGKESPGEELVLERRRRRRTGPESRRSARGRWPQQGGEI